jgi:hypothetical protein
MPYVVDCAIEAEVSGFQPPDTAKKCYYGATEVLDTKR